MVRYKSQASASFCIVIYPDVRVTVLVPPPYEKSDEITVPEKLSAYKNTSFASATEVADKFP